MTTPNTPNTPISPNRLAALLAAARAKNKVAGASSLVPGATSPIQESHIDSEILTGRGRDGSVITYNPKQLEFIKLASAGENCVLLGPAGTGKTTCQQGAIERLIQSGRAGVLDADGHKFLASGTPGIVIIAFTRRAVNNIRRFMPEDMKANCITHHKLLEYEPVYYDVIDPVTGKEKKTMRFEPTRNFIRTLSPSIHTIVIEEGSMYSKELFKELTDACPHKPQFIFLGDIQQLPPVFGSAILGYKMLEHPTIELSEVYRQALESPIIRLAHRILSGNGIPVKEFPEWKTPNKLTIHPWKKKLSADTALHTAAAFFTAALSSGAYDPLQDMILIPFNKAFGTDELNKHIANFMARKRETDTYEIIAGFEKLYLSVGDKVLYDKEDAEVIAISRNLGYTGKSPQKHSKTLDYWGYDSEAGGNRASSKRRNRIR
jgi:ATP-dependent exoDNAse (exonuclease V) alpha subunit